MEVAVRDYGVLQTLEDSVRSNVHTIQSSGLSKTEEAVRYPWLTREVIRIVPGNVVLSGDDTSVTQPEAQLVEPSGETTVPTEDRAPSVDASESAETEAPETSDAGDTGSESNDTEITEDDDSDTASDENETT